MRKKTILALLLTFFTVGIWAQDETASDPAIIIWLNDGNKAQVLFRIAIHSLYD